MGGLDLGSFQEVRIKSDEKIILKLGLGSTSVGLSFYFVKITHKLVSSCQNEPSDLKWQNLNDSAVSKAVMKRQNAR